MFTAFKISLYFIIVHLLDFIRDIITEKVKVSLL